MNLTASSNTALSDTASSNTASSNTASSLDSSRQLLSKLLPLALVALCGILVASAASATLWVRVSDENLVRQTIDRGGVIVEVQAGDWSPAYSAHVPSTDQHMVVRDVIHGDLAGAQQLTVRWLGGETSSGHALKIEGVEPLPRQATAILFLTPGADGTWRAKHLFQGVFHTVTHDGVDYAYRALGGTELDMSGKILSSAGDKLTLEAERAREVEPFAAWIRSLSAGSPTAAKYWSDVSLDVLRATLAEKNYEKFTLISNPGIRFRQFDTGASVSWRAHQSGQPGLPGGGFAEIQAAIAAWNNDPGSRVNYRYAGTTGATGGLSDFDQVNAVLFEDLDAGGFDEPFNCFQGGTVAAGGPWFSNQVSHQHQGQTFRTALGADVVTNENTGCLFENRATAREVFGHEFGHTLGLGHSCGDDASGSCAGRPNLDDAMMRASVHGDGRGARLNPDDRAGINLLYPAAATQPPAAPTGLSASNGGLGVVNLNWTDNATNETGFQVERRNDTLGGGFSQIGSTGTNASSFTDSAAPTGSSVTYRVRASNSAGNSAYSNNSAVATGGPTPPSSLLVTALSSGTLRLQWTDETTDETGFEVQMRREGSEFTFATLLEADPDATMVDIEELFSDSGFEFRMRALTDAGNSSWTPVASGSTLPYMVGDPCVPGDATLCLNGGRYQNRTLWRDFDGLAGLGQRISTELSTDSGLFWFFGEDNWEMLVKNLDACTFNDRVWVFSAATTNVEYTLQVVDTFTGEIATYFNPLGTAAPAVTDIDALQDACDATAPFAAPVEAPRAASSGLPVDKNAGCTPVVTGTDTTLFLNDGRFEVEVDWLDFAGEDGPGTVVQFCSDDSGLFWFFGEDNWEMLVKILNACTFNDHYWVFSAATTNVEYTLRVTDRVADVTKTYFNPLGQASSAVTDTAAFATCP